MASFTHVGKALKDRRGAWSLASVVVRHGSGSRNTRDVNSTLKCVRSDLISCTGASSSSSGGGSGSGSSSGCAETMPINSSSGHVRFLPTVSPRHFDVTSATSCRTLNELSAATCTGSNSSCNTSNTNTNNNNSINSGNNDSSTEVGQALLYGRRRKRSSETIRHDKLYLQTSDFSKREYVQTWNDFQGKRSIPTTEWGKRHSED